MVKAIHTGLPPFLNSALIPFSSPFHSTRYSSPANFTLSTVACNSFHASKSQLNYSFDYIVSPNWNSLPDIVSLAPSVLTFSKRLNTYLFWQPFLLYRHSFLFGWISWFFIFHNIRLLYTGCALDYALSFYRHTINLPFILIVIIFKKILFQQISFIFTILINWNLLPYCSFHFF